MSALLRRDVETDVQLRDDGDNGDGRTLDIRLVPWDVVAETPDGREMFRRGAFEGIEPGTVSLESQRHGGELVGRAVSLEERDDGGWMSARVSKTRAGDDLLELIRDGVCRAASIEFAPIGQRRRRDGVTERTRVDLRRVAVLERGSYPGAGVMAIREEPSMTDVLELPAEAPALDLGPLTGRLDAIESRIGALATLGAAPAVTMYRAESLGELLRTTYDDPTLKRALVDQLTGENPGLMPPGVLSQAVGIVNLGRRTINAFGARSLPPKGMTVQWPTLTTPLTGLVNLQATEKTAIVSAKVSFGSGSEDIRTFAGGSDVSYQLIRRSDPPYLEQYARVMLAAWSQLTNNTFLATLQAQATGNAVWAPAGDTDGSAFVGALVEASVEIEAATGAPAEFAILATDLFTQVAGIFAQKSINPTAAGGTALAGTLTVNVSGLPVIHEPQLATGTGFVSNRLAAGWLEDPVGAPAQISAEDVERLGQNVAYWSMGAPAVFIPAGIVEFSAVVGTAAERRTRKDASA